MEIVQAVKKLNSISRERLNFRRRPILCTTLYRNPMQASNFGGTFDQLFLWIFLWNFYRRCLSISSIPWCKKVKNDQKLKSRGPTLTEGDVVITQVLIKIELHIFNRRGLPLKRWCSEVQAGMFLKILSSVFLRNTFFNMRAYCTVTYLLAPVLISHLQIPFNRLYERLLWAFLTSKGVVTSIVWSLCFFCIQHYGTRYGIWTLCSQFWQSLVR